MGHRRSSIIMHLPCSTSSRFISSRFVRAAAAMAPAASSSSSTTVVIRRRRSRRCCCCLRNATPHRSVGRSVVQPAPSAAAACQPPSEAARQTPGSADRRHCACGRVQHALIQRPQHQQQRWTASIDLSAPAAQHRSVPAHDQQR